MKKITSFSIDHDILEPGVYVSRIDQDVVTYDLRFKKPNQDNYMDIKGTHSLEHLFATYARNSRFSKDVLYIGPMGCLTGLYLLTRTKMSRLDTLSLITECFNNILNHQGPVPGSQKKECGNYVCHDLLAAQKLVQEYMPILNAWTTEKMDYLDTTASVETEKRYIGLIGAMPSEIKYIIKKLENREDVLVNDLTFHTGFLHNKPIVLVQSGIGKVSAARVTQTMIDHFPIQYIINTGIAGGIGPNIKIKDLVIGDCFIQYDFDASAFGYAKGYLCTGKDPQTPTRIFSDKNLVKTYSDATQLYLDKSRVHIGCICTGDLFLTDSTLKKELASQYDAVAVDMESAAIAFVANANLIPFVVIRAISDIPGVSSPKDYESFEEEVAHHSANTLFHLLEQSN